ncbi:MAG: glycosyltransferase [Candidatus Omnitrophota bacterium]|nr:glycosyltransferase [Candidatus Omnitrophota bacterium]
MKVSGFTIVRNAIKFNYPAVESIRSILPICDEFIINVGDSEDATLEMIESINSPKIKIMHSNWDFSEGEVVLGKQTNAALSKCTGDWAFYLQSDELVHENDLPVLRRLMQRYLNDQDADALRFKWLHFFGSYYRYRIDGGWFQKEDRIIKNNGEVESFSGAFGFRRKDGKQLRRIKTNCFIYHYGWVQPPKVMTQRRVNAEKIGFTSLQEEERKNDYDYGDLNRFPVYFGTHPAVMKQKVAAHLLSNQDWQKISKKYWWSPLRWFRIRYKTFKRIRQKIT